MDIVGEIHVSRDCGVVHCGVSSRPSPSLTELASEFGLEADVPKYKEIDPESARWLVELILNQDIAYNSEIMPAARAAGLAGRFLALFGTDSVRFYTNGTFHERRGPKLTWPPSASWDPVTAATFDTGVLILGPRCSGCLWVEDED